MAAPVARRRIGLAVPVATLWATDYSPLGTPLMHPGTDAEVVRCFFDGAAGPGGLLAIPYLPLASQTASRLTGADIGPLAIAAREKRAGHDAGAAGEAQLEAAFSGKRRKEMRRLLRRLDEDGASRFESLTESDASRGFEEFLALEASGWKGRSGTALISKPQTAAFSLEAIAGLARLGRVRIDQFWSGDRLIASLVLIEAGGQVFSWKIAFDEAYGRYSPGAQIALYTFRQNLALPGFMGADSLAVPGHSMIEPLWRGRLETGTMVLAQGAAGSLKLRLATADLAAEQALRRLARSVRQRLKR
ncbi:GNAT family N-acetyltransferase [Roseibium salinum]